jgi:hypothetical protein
MDWRRRQVRANIFPYNSLGFFASRARICKSVSLMLQSSDVETAFLMPFIERPLFMTILQGYESRFRPPGASAKDYFVCKLLKSIPGIPEASRLFWKKVTADLTAIGFVPCASDSCLFVWKGSTSICIVAVWVDDFLFAYSDESIFSSTVTKLTALGYTQTQWSSAGLPWCSVHS